MEIFNKMYCKLHQEWDLKLISLKGGRIILSYENKNGRILINIFNTVFKASSNLLTPGLVQLNCKLNIFRNYRKLSNWGLIKINYYRHNIIISNNTSYSTNHPKKYALGCQRNILECVHFIQSKFRGCFT